MRYDLAGNISAYEEGRLDNEDIITLFQYLVDTGLAWSLQGHYGRSANQFIQAGLVEVRR